MRKHLIKILSFLLISTNALMAQSSYKERKKVKFYNQAVLAFNQQEYALAKQYFDKVDEDAQNTLSVYKLLTNLALNNALASIETENYLLANPFATQKTTIVLALANHYFKKRWYKKALYWFKSIDVKTLTDTQEANCNYKLAFLYYTQKKYTKAKQYLIPIAKKGAYQKEAHYYLGNIAMQNKDYKNAVGHFNKIEHIDRYKKEIAYQKLVVLYKTKKYKQAIVLGEAYYAKTKNFREKSQMAKIIGESYFYQKKYTKAIHYLLAYKAKRRKTSAVDYYFLGYAYYQLKNNDKAIENFNKITEEKSVVAQNAHYHLGACYLSKNQKTAALNAFKNASEMTFDVEIQQDAFLNYAKLSYEIGNPYKSSPEVLQDFIDQYPNALVTKELQDLIVNAYLQRKDYQGAIGYYDQQKLFKDKQYQQLLLQNGLELFTVKKHKQALPFFTKATAMFMDKVIKQKSLFWKAETLFQLYRLKDAVYQYKLFLNHPDAKKTKVYADGIYGCAYGLFQQKKYQEALPYFKKYVLIGQSSAKKANAILRIADCYFVSKNYWQALENYNKIIAINKGFSDYAWYQKALSYGFLGRDDQKEATLKNLQKKFSTSPYLDKSYFQLGNMYGNKNKNSKALKAYDALIKTFPKSALVSKAKLKKGIILFNTNNNQAAISVLKSVVADYPGTAEAVQAVKTAEQVYKDMGQVDLYAKWVKQLEFVNISDADIDNSMFEAVENKYLSGELAEAVSSCKKYLAHFPNGAHALTVHFYLAQAYVGVFQKQNAIPSYQEVLKANTNEYTAVALDKLSQIYLENEQWDLASKLLLRIEQTTTNVASQVYAQSNLMKYYYKNKQHQQVLSYVNKVLNNSKSTQKAVADAYLYGARSAMQTKDFNQAKTYYQKLETIGIGVVKAEAFYHKAFWLHQKKKYKKSNEQVQFLTSNFQQYKYWGVKGLLLMAQNFDALKDDFQAIFILNNVIKNAQEFKDLTQKATVLLKKYKTKSPVTKGTTKESTSDDGKEDAMVLDAVNEI